MPIRGQFPAVIRLSNLNGKNGIEFDGLLYDDTGYFVSRAGDINGDGINDILIGAPSAYKLGSVYVVFGKRAWNNPIALSRLNTADGYIFDGVDNSIGALFNSAGDLNNDGFSDIIIGTFGSFGEEGKCYVVFGKSNWSNTVSLNALDGTQGFELKGLELGAYNRYSVSAADDINGDNIQDIIIGSPGANDYSGKIYLVFGKSNWSSPLLINNTNMVELNGVTAGSWSGYSVSSAGDINGDGRKDIIIGAPYVTGGTGKIYVIFGKTNWTTPLKLNYTDGFVLEGESLDDTSGNSVSEAGDINGDNLTDIIIGARYASSSNFVHAGKAYVIFGKSNWSSPISLSNLTPPDGCVIEGDSSNAEIGRTVSDAGDFNNDGFGDIIISGYRGKVYVIFGKSNWNNSIEVNNLNGTLGFQIYGASGGPVNIPASRAGDVNADGIEDIIIGSKSDNKAYIIFGERPEELILLSNNIVIHAGQTVNLNSSYLNVSSPKNPNNIYFTISNLQHGIFQYKKNPGIGITSFTQQSVWDEQVQLVHDAGRIALNYDVQTNTDTFVFIPPQSANVTFIPAVPQFVYNQLNIARGQTVYITPINLQASELGNSNDGNFIFSLSNILYGQFLNPLGEAETSFTQQMIRDGVIRFAHDGSSNAPSYDVAISDGQIITSPKAAIISFNPTINTTITTSHNTIRNAIISGSVSGAVGLGFFALKLYIQRQAAKNLKKVLEVDNSETEADQIEFHNHVIRPIASQLFEHIKTTGCLGYRTTQTSRAYLVALGSLIGKLSSHGVNIDLRQLKPAKRVVLINEVIRQIKRHCIQRNFVTRFINCKPDITPQLLEEKTDAIITEVCAALPREFFSAISDGSPNASAREPFEMKEMRNLGNVNVSVSASDSLLLLQRTMQSDEKEPVNESVDIPYCELAAKPASIN